MGNVKLELPCAKKLNGVASDPEPDWSLEALLTELNALDLKLNMSSSAPSLKTQSRYASLCWRGSPAVEDRHKKLGGFRMRVQEDDMGDSDSSDREIYHCSLAGSGTRFYCDDAFSSDSEGSVSDLDIRSSEVNLMDKPGVVEVVLFESKRERRLRIEEEIRNSISAIEADLRSESEKTASALLRIDNYINARKESDRRHDKQYQRRIAEELDNHLSAIQRDHEQLSLIEERKIRADAAVEEARKKEKAQYEEKMRQERAKAEEKVRQERARAEEKMRQERAKEEAEARLKAAKAAEEIQKAALEAEGRAAKEAIEMQAAEAQRDLKANDAKSQRPGPVAQLREGAEGVTVKGSKTALKLEEERLGVYKRFVDMNSALNLESNKGLRSYERQIARRFKQISGTIENIRAKATDLIKIFNDPVCPQSFSIAVFAKAVVSSCEDPTMRIPSTAFACARVVVLVSSQFPVAMDLVLAEFHRVCVYTVPKHISSSESVHKTKEAYLEGIEGYMTLYAALVQTEINGLSNLHGLKEGWAWLARFLNTMPANSATAVALLAFLKIAGYALYQKYKSQMKKLINIISKEFLGEWKSISDPRLHQVVVSIETYISNNQFLRQPEGWSAETNLISKTQLF